jgi:transcriptional antiterminator
MMENYSQSIVPTNQVLMAIVKNFLIHFVDRKSLHTQFLEHIMKFIQRSRS